MSAEAPETVLEDVAAPTQDTGKEVWCENGCGNRILEAGEPIPFPCPTGCGGFMTEDKPAAFTGKTKSVDLPTVGRIVHVRIGPGTVRPAIVMGRESDGRCLVTVFLHPGDPTLPGLGLEGVGVVPYGDHLGGWLWPPREQKLQFDAPDE